jgi:sulfite reductase alpha subunit-like flavoprotein
MQPSVPWGSMQTSYALRALQALSPWLTAFWERIDELMPLLPSQVLVPASQRPAPRYVVAADMEGGAGEKQAGQALGAAPDARPDRGGSVPPSRARPFAARVLCNKRLTADHSVREVRHIALSIAGAGMRYAPGDAVAVQPRNPVERTLGLLGRLGLNPSNRIEIRAAGPHAPPLFMSSCTVLELFTQVLDVFGVPRRSFFRLLAHFATEPAQRERLEEFGDATVCRTPPPTGPTPSCLSQNRRATSPRYAFRVPRTC